MIKSTLKRKDVSSINGTRTKYTTNNKTLSFENQCKENTRQQIIDLKFGKCVVSNLIAFKLN